MKVNKTIPTAVISTLFALSLSSQAFAHSKEECSVNLENGITISDAYVKVFNKDNILYQIETNGQLTVDGKVINLSAEQQKLSVEYATELRTVVPKAVNLAIDGVEMAGKGINVAFTTAFGANSELEQNVTKVLDKVREKINANLHFKNGEYTIAPDGIDNLENAFDEELEDEIAGIAMNSMGSVLTLIGEAMKEGEGTSEQRMKAFGLKMAKLGEEVKNTMEFEGAELKGKVISLCQELKAVDALENKLFEEIPVTAKNQLLNIQ